MKDSLSVAYLITRFNCSLVLRACQYSECNYMMILLFISFKSFVYVIIRILTLKFPLYGILLIFG